LAANQRCEPKCAIFRLLCTIDAGKWNAIDFLVLGLASAIKRRSDACYSNYIVSHCAGKRVLEIGCGPGSIVARLTHAASCFVGIDISDVAVQQAADPAKANGANQHYLLMNAEHTAFASGSFDLICGGGILHHLDLNKVLPELARILKPTGSAIFVEPLGHNPMINLYRQWTPTLRSVDEHPLRDQDLRLIRDSFRSLELSYFHLSSFAVVPFRSTRMFPALLAVFDWMDSVLFRSIPYVGK